MIDDESSVTVVDDSWSWFHWVPTSMMALKEAEKKIFLYLSVPLRKWFVHIGPLVGSEENYVRTVCANEDNSSVPLVLVHGFGAGVALWSLNLGYLSKKRPVYAFDILGFGRSSRPPFSSRSEEAEKQLVESIEEWRKSVGLEQFILLGHSMGGYLATAYTLNHPHHVKHLILADPWGFQEKRPDNTKRLPIWAKVILAMVQPFNPLSVLRAAGPWGPGLVDRFRPDIKAKFQSLVEDQQTITNYIYHCNAQTPSGESAFKALTYKVGWAKHPMVNRIIDINPRVPISFIYGALSWMDQASGNEVKANCRSSKVDVHVIPNAGHHVYADEPELFNKLVDEICNETDTVDD